MSISIDSRLYVRVHAKHAAARISRVFCFPLVISVRVKVRGKSANVSCARVRAYHGRQRGSSFPPPYIYVYMYFLLSRTDGFKNVATRVLLRRKYTVGSLYYCASFENNIIFKTWQHCEFSQTFFHFLCALNIDPLPSLHIYDP